MIKEARINELKQEMINSDKLQVHFDDHPEDLELLQHDRALLPKKVKKHLKVIPNYLLPPSLQRTYETPISKVEKRRVYNPRSTDPLQTITLGMDNVPINNAIKSNESDFVILTARNRWRKKHYKNKRNKNKRRKLN